MSRDLKVLLLDLELTYAIYYAFPSKKPQYLSSRQVKQHQSCVCGAWKWLDETSVQSIATTTGNDSSIAKKLHKVMTDADIIVAHNADAFDIKHANTMFINHGLGPIPETKSIDTLKVARKYFAFSGNDLDSLSKRFGGKGKSDKPDWIKLTERDKKEIAKATKYCEGDVRELERVFIALRPYISKMPHLKLSSVPTECPCCKSKRVISKGSAFDGYRMYKRMKCQECGHEIKVKGK